MDSVLDTLTARYGAIGSFERFPCPFENRPFYDVARFTAGGETHVAKWSAPDRADVLRSEYDVSTFLRARGFPTAAAEFIDGDIALMVMEFFPGRDLRADDVEAARIREIAELLRRLHAITPDEAPASTQRRIASCFVDEERAVFFAKSPAAAEAFEPAAWARVQRAFEVLATGCTYPGIRGLCRRDLHHGNWYLHEDGKLRMLDLQNAIISDIANDLCEIDGALTSDDSLLAVFRTAYGPETYDAATQPDVRALHSLEADVARIARMRRVQPQPEREAELRARIETAVRHSESA